MLWVTYTLTFTVLLGPARPVTEGEGTGNEALYSPLLEPLLDVLRQHVRGELGKGAQDLEHSPGRPRAKVCSAE